MHSMPPPCFPKTSQGKLDFQENQFHISTRRWKDVLTGFIIDISPIENLEVEACRRQ